MKIWYILRVLEEKLSRQKDTPQLDCLPQNTKAARGLLCKMGKSFKIKLRSYATLNGNECTLASFSPHLRAAERGCNTSRSPKQNRKGYNVKLQIRWPLMMPMSISIYSLLWTEVKWLSKTLEMFWTFNTESCDSTSPQAKAASTAFW